MMQLTLTPGKRSEAARKAVLRKVGNGEAPALHGAGAKRGRPQVGDFRASLVG